MQVFTHVPSTEALLTDIRAMLPNYLVGNRLNHVYFVEKEAIALAESCFMVYNVPMEYERDLRAAALLHDITKPLPLEKQLELCERYGILPGEHPSAALLHSKTGAHLARERFGINDAVFSAIFRHTTGDEGMNVLDKILFLADYIEPSRVHRHCAETRAYFYDELAKRGAHESAEILDEAILMSIDGTVEYLLSRGEPVDTQTLRTKEDILAHTKHTHP